MNLQTRTTFSLALVAAASATRNRQMLTPEPSEFRRESRTRDFGVGYGRSSGYASSRRYTSNWGNARFEFC
ncbi:hypothetical protein [Luteimonas panaciterrae]|uniref:hypothetical protein n=1 Tax=Luteimonas panaciterrae TaxID=363885 RepID=UPI001CFBB026|nr:hypothetical protein [Luteimonas panaciterrae]